jgi:hypothetical protein
MRLIHDSILARFVPGRNSGIRARDEKIYVVSEGIR